MLSQLSLLKTCDFEMGLARIHHAREDEAQELAEELKIVSGCLHR